MKLTGVELRRIQMPLVAPFRTSFGTETCRDVLLLRVVTDDGEGWGECVAMSDPLYSSEYVDAAADVLRRFLIPAVAAERLDATRWAGAGAVQGHRMAKAALEMAVLDAELRGRAAVSPRAGRRARRSLWSVGRHHGLDRELLDAVGGYLDEGYVRIKLKISPAGTWSRSGPCGSGSATTCCCRSTRTPPTRWPTRASSPARSVRVAADRAAAGRGGRAGTRGAAKQIAPRSASMSRSRRPGPPRTRSRWARPRSSTSSPAGSGGYLEARRIHDVCVAHGVPVWCGGMLETGIGRAANVALAALPGFTLPGTPRRRTVTSART
jgi:O-succinylbenzoate synthase